MKFKKILVTGFSKENLDNATWNKISSFADQIVFDFDDGADCLFCRFNKVNKALIDSLPSLKYIGLLATGTGTVYPPIGFISQEARGNKQAIFVSNIESFLKGTPSNRVN